MKGGRPDEEIRSDRGGSCNAECASYGANQSEIYGKQQDDDDRDEQTALHEGQALRQFLHRQGQGLSQVGMI
jgi:hypothetical protein